MVPLFSIFNADGSVQADLNTRLPRILGRAIIGINGASNDARGTITHPEFGVSGKPFVIPLGWSSNGPGSLPAVRIHDTYIEWYYQPSAYAGGKISGRVIYGVY